MSENNILKKFTTFFGIFMVFFYIGVGGYIIFSHNLSHIDKALRVILGATLILYGIYRAARSYYQIVELFTGKKKEDNDLY